MVILQKFDCKWVSYPSFFNLYKMFLLKHLETLEMFTGMETEH